MDERTRTLLIELSKRSDDPIAFAEIRSRILQRYFDQLPFSRRPQAEALQAHIEAVRVVAGTPGRAAMAILDDIGDKCDALEEAGRQLKKEYSADRP